MKKTIVDGLYVELSVCSYRNDEDESDTHTYWSCWGYLFTETVPFCRSGFLSEEAAIKAGKEYLRNLADERFQEGRLQEELKGAIRMLDGLRTGEAP